MENARYTNLNSAVPVCIRQKPRFNVTFLLYGPVTGLALLVFPEIDHYLSRDTTNLKRLEIERSKASLLVSHTFHVV